MREVISRGKNLKEAISLGLIRMNLTESQVNIEIIQGEDKKYFGIFGYKPAIILMREKVLTDSQKILVEGTSPLQKEMDFPRNVHPTNVKIDYGEVWVKDGQIYCKESATHYPTITLPDGVLLYRNGELAKKTVAIMRNDILKLKFENEWKTLTWSISFNTQKTEAILKVEPGYRRTYRLVDQEPSPDIDLEIQLKEETIIHPQLVHIEQRMKELGINTGIQTQEIQRALETTEPGEFIIAEGRIPIPGEDGWFESAIFNKKMNRPLLLEDGSIDLQGFMATAYLEKGQLIGTIHAPKQGKNGNTVTGNKIPFRPLEEIRIEVQHGVELVDQYSKIVAVSTGRSNIEIADKHILVGIISTLNYKGTLSAEKVFYHGDVVIDGNTEKSSIVEALANVYVIGSTRHVTISAGSQLIISHDVINSHLKTGKIVPLYSNLLSVFERIVTNLENFSSAINQIYQSPAFKTADIKQVGLSTLIGILLEKKFIDLPLLIKELNDTAVKEVQLNILSSQIREIHKELVHGFIEITPACFKEKEDIDKLAEKIRNVCDMIPDYNQNDASIVIPYAINSKLNSTGDISIIGKGSVNSDIHADGFVLIKGLLSGGEVYGAKGIEVEEAGSFERGINTRLVVPNDQTIKINKVKKNTTIQIGNHIHRFLDTEEAIVATIDANNKLVLR